MYIYFFCPRLVFGNTYTIRSYVGTYIIVKDCYLVFSTFHKINFYLNESYF